MAVVLMLPVLLIASLTWCRCEPTNGHNYNNGNVESQFGDVLRPPPPPPLSIAPAPFHGGVGRVHRQNNDLGYLYQQPPPSGPPPTIAPGKFNFPAPFYKQYNFNFVPPPQPFSTTPSPTIFQKLSGWLFSSQQVSDTGTPINNTPLKKDCNPCNTVPWIPVIRYDLSAEKEHNNINPSYGSPNPQTVSEFNMIHSVPQPFQSQVINLNPTGTPHAIYGVPPASHIKSFKSPSSTYGPPSPTHIVPVIMENPYNTQYPISSNSLYDLPSVSSFPSSSYLPSSSYTTGSTYKPQSSTFISTSIQHENKFSSTTHSPISAGYKAEFLNKYRPSQNNIDIRELDPPKEQQLPKVSQPSKFKNSYGEPIINTYTLDIPYSVSAAESIKVNNEVLPNATIKSNIPNMSLALANPAPFSLNRGRNIHTLQPVALPNLSVSPLPPIFNARPFRPLPIKYPFNVIQDNLISNNLNIDKSVPIAEYTHLEYPTTIIQSPVIDIDALKNVNNSNAYRNIENSYVIDEIRDISPQASEDHTHISKAKQEASFESIGPDFNNDLYDAGIPLEIVQSPDVPYNHKVSFADLRGVKDEDIDKYRTESNLQYIDSPLLYLKPSAPHKNYKNFGFTTSTTEKGDYEIYDENPTTSSPKQATVTHAWDERRDSPNKRPSPSIGAHENRDRPKIVQIIVPYTTDKRHDKNENLLPHQQKWVLNTEKEYQARKIHANTERNFETSATEVYTNLSTVTEESVSTSTEQYDHAVSNDMYDVKEPPFDIIKLQHTIDDWTEQEYSNIYGSSQKSRSSEKYAKQIPDDYFTTNNPTTGYVTDMVSDSYDLYDHEGSSSIQHAVTDNKTNIFAINRNDYNILERNKHVHESAKNDEKDNKKGFHIYTAASIFRTTTSTAKPAPWEKIQTSISPLTNEKVYVVTSKPWRENITKESNQSDMENEREDIIDTDDLPFKLPRFSNRPLYGFTSDAIELEKLDSPYGYSSGWHRRINNLGNDGDSENTSVEDESDLIPITAKAI